MANEKKSTATNIDHSTHIINIDYIKNAQDVQEVQGLKIDPTFRDMIPKLTDDEFSQLEKNILEDGKVKEPIVVWNGTIIDGHHRFYVVLMHPEIPYEIEERDFDNEWAVMAWACANQLGRRNLSDKDYRYLIGERYKAEKMVHGGIRSSQNTKASSAQSGHLRPQGKTADRVAKELGIGRNTVQRYGKFAEGVDIAENIIPGAKENILHGDINISKTAIQKIPDVTPDKQKEATEAIMENNCSKADKILYGKDAHDLSDSLVSGQQTDPYNADDLAGDIRASSETMIQTLEQILFISHTDIAKSIKGNSKAQSELKNHIVEINKVIDRLNDKEEK